MGNEQGQYWFTAKRYGYGWGLPCAWQGWAVLLGYLALILGPRLLGGEQATPLSVRIAVVATPILLVICYYKGEPAKWRWGGE